MLGQFDPFHDPSGRLLLVAPNIVHVERELDVDPADFRLWVCLHEETHRVQFTAVPWMRDHLFGEIDASPTPSSRAGCSTTASSGSPRRSAAAGQPARRARHPGAEEILDRVTGVMSLLEGHADVVMDGVGPSVIPSRRRDPRASSTSAARASAPSTRCCAGCSASTPRWRSTATAPKFVRGVVDKVGMAEFNAVWERPENLPSKAEIADPAAWVARVL